MLHSKCQKMAVFSCMLLAAYLMIGVINSPDLGAAEMGKINGSVGYRERIMLPPHAVVKISLENVAKMDVKAELITSISFEPRGGPPWDFTVEYDPGKIHDKGSYALRARIEVDGRLLFTSTEVIPAFDGEPGAPVDIMVYRVPGKNAGGAEPSPKPSAGLTHTYWKLIELNGEPARLGAGQKELHMVLVAEDSRVRGFSGCNKFTGTYRAVGDHLQFLNVASTKRACLDGMDQEHRFLLALDDTSGFEIKGDSLTLYGTGGQARLVFEAVYLQ